MMYSGASQEYSENSILCSSGRPRPFTLTFTSTLHPAVKLQNCLQPRGGVRIVKWNITACISRMTAYSSLFLYSSKVAAAWSCRVLEAGKRYKNSVAIAGLPKYAPADHDYAFFYCVQPRAVQRLRPLLHPPLRPRAGAPSTLAARRLCATSMTSARV